MSRGWRSFIAGFCTLGCLTDVAAYERGTGLWLWLAPHPWFLFGAGAQAVVAVWAFHAAAAGPTTSKETR